MFDYELAVDVLRDFKYMSKKKRKKILRSMFYDDDFIEWMFQPKKVPNLNEIVTAMYTEFTKGFVMNAIVEVIEDEGPREFTRSHATLLTSIANIAIDANNEELKDIEEKRKAGDYSRREAARLVDEIKDINNIIADLLKCARKIVKKESVEISRNCRIPKYIAVTALTSIPDPKYIGKFQIGFYLNNTLNTIYSEVERNGDFELSVKWREFFKYIFGKDNVIEAATFVLLEGVNRVNKYKNSEDVCNCWDSLTSFALKELNDSPNQIREQMIELYIKRIEKMFLNKSFDLRVNLLDIDDYDFPKLTETVKKYADKISNILKL